MLIYHPAYDAYHCVFRMLLIAEHVKGLETDKARLLDFYLVFPGLVRKIRLPDSLRELRAQAKKVVNVYRDPVSEASTFQEMRHIQEAALRAIAASGLLEMGAFSAGYISRSKASLPSSLAEKLTAFLEESGPIATGVLKGLSEIPLLGHDGLKHRTQLMEYRYDFA
ncbi:ABC-three component system middle component 5 [Burkholderia ubonensis]|uniref:ABC-three component system middle component 5 n=1 Tax=Burkholderia ubonensis TaxID=101571 RepID=UPI000757B938|nr:ABC-three component system middle component 5 [Burkholderia ubonensis]KVT83340.1 hypothetical protein WK58_03935 [Burkholderia ubonensis]KVW76103.1 hypothetical protein WK99_29475 [Burkholderia ubonensis]OJA32260.1 hypothetical protein BGV47_23585 [Burkholderia ubonensis]OJB30535.1 hypothetical protein BGV55_12270 [Burkholderia ubonensis]